MKKIISFTEENLMLTVHEKLSSICKWKVDVYYSNWLSGWNLGCIVMVLLAYLIRDWSYLQISFAVLSLGLASIYFWVPESPRWLLSQGHFDQVDNKNKIFLTICIKVKYIVKIKLSKLRFIVNYQQIYTKPNSF